MPPTDSIVAMPPPGFRSPDGWRRGALPGILAGAAAALLGTLVPQGARAAEVPSASPPRITALAPLAVPQGFSGTVRLRGIGLKENPEIRTTPTHPTLQLTLRATNDAMVPAGMEKDLVGDSEGVVELQVPTNHPPGPLPLIIMRDGHISEPAALQVLPADRWVEAVEPDNGFRSARVLQPGQTASGAIQEPRDVDVFQVDGRAGHPLRISVIARAVASLLDPLLTAYDARGRMLTTRDDEGLQSRDVSLEVHPAADGPLYFAVQDALDTGSDWHSYRLEVSRLPGPGGVSFAREVWPVLRANCLSCHRPGKLKGDLDLSSMAALTRGGRHGGVVKAGAPEDSPLILAIRGEDPDMPPEGERLSDSEVELLTRWVAEGALDDSPPGGPGTRRPTEPPVYTTPPAVPALAFSPDGTRLAVTAHHEVVIHRGDGTGVIGRWMGDSPRLESVAFSRDGRLLAASGGAPSEFGEIQLWDATVPRFEGRMRRAIRAGPDTLFGVSWSEDGTRLAAGGADQRVRAFDAATGTQVMQCDNHLDWVFGTAFVLDGSRLVSVSRDRAVKLIDVETGHLVDDAARPREPVLALARHPMEDLVAFTGDEGKVRLHRMAPRGGRLKEGDDREESAVREFEHMATPLHAVAFSPDGARLACGGQSGEIRLFDTETGKRLATVPAGNGPIFALAFHPKENWIAAAGADGQVRFYDTTDGTLVKTFPAVPLTTLAADSVSDAAATGSVPSFQRDILPIFTKFGCNQGGCHGKISGQNGFRLSLRGYAPEWDHEWLTREVNGRRVNPAFPGASLVLEKPSGGVTHEGGTRFRKGSRPWRTLADWIAARAPGPIPDESMPVALEVQPESASLKPGDRVTLKVMAREPDGTTADVTWLAEVFSNDEAILRVSPDGEVTARGPGESSVRVHFLNLVQVVPCTIPHEHPVAPHQFAERRSPVDGPVFDKLQAIRSPPSGDCDDGTFVRRAFLDTLGVLPTPAEVSGFLADTRPDKRAALADQILGRPEWLDYWTLQLADLLQNRRERDHDVRGAKGVRAFHAWLRARLAAGAGWDVITREILTATGDVRESPEVGYFITVIGEHRDVETSELPDSVAQSFLGTRIGCARCHNHPLERYTQDDFYRFAAFFGRTSLARENPHKGGTVLENTSRREREQAKRVTELSRRLRDAVRADAPPEEREQLSRELGEGRRRLDELAARPPEAVHLRTGKAVAARALDGTAPDLAPGDDPRAALADWVTSSPEFAGAMVNRLWKHFFATGLVEPVDDLRASNPPSNPALWTLLCDEFRGQGYDLRHVMRLILTSRAYQLRSDTLPENETDTRFYSHYQPRRLPAEVLLDALSDATGVDDSFPGHAVGLRAVQLPEPGVGSYFLTLFGRSDRVTACACERTGTITLPQLLNLRNGEELQRRLGDPEGRLARLLKHAEDPAVLEALYQATLCRQPTESERALVASSLAIGPRDEVFRDLFWALLNSKEFAFNH